jgi:hypothetical protein
MKIVIAKKKGLSTIDKGFEQHSRVLRMYLECITCVNCCIFVAK